MLQHHNSDAQAPSRVVILGPNGFVGRRLVAHLNANKTPVLSLGREQVDLTAGNAADKISAELRSDDTLVFLAALTPDKGRGIPPFLDNLKMAAAVCAAIEAKPPAHIVYVSSDAVYPFRSGLVDETSCAEPNDLYAAMHMAREIMIKQSAKAPLAILRPTLIYGADDTHNSYGPNRLRRMARKDGRISLFGDGEETRDHIYIDDVVALIELVIRHRSAGLLNLATGKPVAFSDLARMVASLFPSTVEVNGTPRKNPVTHRAFDVTALLRSFPKFRFTGLEEGLAAAHQQEIV
ncbi:MAG: dependent epimerase/dehydratase family [Xanthobacteraceae bacterium]|jgi:nucleoside-diphosphate-sugar epimerase|nr:dependent epimerase/dehydratase family [Xanthobacteraceae bacterium]